MCFTKVNKSHINNTYACDNINTGAGLQQVWQTHHKMGLLAHLDLVGDVDSGGGLGHVVQQQYREVGWEMCCQCAGLIAV